MDQEFISFDDAMKELNLRSAELKKLMSEGQIRGVREGEDIKFRRDEVEKLNLQADSEEIAEELLFVEEDEGLDEGMATAQISEEDTLLEAEPEVLEEDIELPEVEDEVEELEEVDAGRRRPEVVIDYSNYEKPWVRGLVILTSIILIYGALTLLAAGDAESNPLTDPVVPKSAK